MYVYIYTCIYLYISLYICILYMPISVNYFRYLSGTFLVHVLRPNSFHRCSNFTSHCRSFTSLPQKRLWRHARAFYFPVSKFSSSISTFMWPLAFVHTLLGLKWLDIALLLAPKQVPAAVPDLLLLHSYCCLYLAHYCTLFSYPPHGSGSLARVN